MDLFPLSTIVKFGVVPAKERMALMKLFEPEFLQQIYDTNPSLIFLSMTLDWANLIQLPYTQKRTLVVCTNPVQVPIGGRSK